MCQSKGVKSLESLWIMHFDTLVLIFVESNSRELIFEILGEIRKI